MAYRTMVTVPEDAWRGSQKLMKELGINSTLYNQLLSNYITKQFEILQIMKKKRDSGESVNWVTFCKMNGILNDESQIELIS